MSGADLIDGVEALVQDHLRASAPPPAPAAPAPPTADDAPSVEVPA